MPITFKAPMVPWTEDEPSEEEKERKGRGVIEFAGPLLDADADPTQEAPQQDQTDLQFVGEPTQPDPDPTRQFVGEDIDPVESEDMFSPEGVAPWTKQQLDKSDLAFKHDNLTGAGEVLEALGVREGLNEFFKGLLSKEQREKDVLQELLEGGKERRLLLARGVTGPRTFSR